MDRQEFQRICEAIEPDERGCRIWPHGKTAQGYPQLSLDRYPANGHVLALEIKLGRKLLPGMNALHSCDVKACVSYDHLEEGTHQKNMEDASKRGRMASGDRNGSRTHPERRPRGSNCGSAVLDEQGVMKVCELLEKDIPQHRIGIMMGVSQNTISLISLGKTWGHLTGRPRRV